jgi:hypothetical protein
MKSYTSAKNYRCYRYKKIEQENKLLIEENNKNRNIKLNTAENLYRLADNSMHLMVYMI